MLIAAIVMLSALSSDQATAVISPPDTTQGAKPLSAAGDTAAANDPESVKCRSVREVGSRIPTRICRTVGEWGRIDADNEQALIDQKRSGGQKPGSGTIFE